MRVYPILGKGSDADVIQVYPIAFIEFHKDADGKVTREGPRREKDELAAHDAWTVSSIPDLIPSSDSPSTEEARSRISTPSEGSRRQMQAVHRLGPTLRSQVRIVASERRRYAHSTRLSPYIDKRLCRRHARAHRNYVR